MSSHLAHVVALIFDCPHLARRSQRFFNATWLLASSKCLTLSSSRISFSSLRPTLVYNSTQTRQNNTIRLESDALSHDIIQNKYSKLQVKLVTSMACGAGLSLRRMVGWLVGSARCLVSPVCLVYFVLKAHLSIQWMVIGGLIDFFIGYLPQKIKITYFP